MNTDLCTTFHWTTRLSIVLRKSWNHHAIYDFYNILHWTSWFLLQQLLQMRAFLSSTSHPQHERWCFSPPHPAILRRACCWPGEKKRCYKILSRAALQAKPTCGCSHPQKEMNKWQKISLYIILNQTGTRTDFLLIRKSELKTRFNNVKDCSHNNWVGEVSHALFVLLQGHFGYRKEESRW